MTDKKIDIISYEPTPDELYAKTLPDHMAEDILKGFPESEIEDISDREDIEVDIFHPDQVLTHPLSK